MKKISISALFKFLARPIVALVEEHGEMMVQSTGSYYGIFFNEGNMERDMQSKRKENSVKSKMCKNTPARFWF